MQVVGQTAQHYDTTKFNIALAEAIKFDFRGLLGDLFYSLNDGAIWQGSVEAKWDQIIDPFEFQNCRNNTVSHDGLKTVLAYFVYARYLLVNEFTDSPNGSVNKTSDFNFPKSFKDVQQFANKYRDMAFDSWSMVHAYICLKGSEVYDTFNFADCSECEDCDEYDNKTGRTKGFGIRSRTITKDDYY
jgi:hypothetical protein